MKKIIGFILSFVLFLQVIPMAHASEVDDLNAQYIELYASQLAYVNAVYKNEGKKVKEIAGVSSDLKDALGEWTVVSVSKNGGSVNVGFEAIVLMNPTKVDKEYVIAFKGSEGSASEPKDKDWIDNDIALKNISSDGTQLTGIVSHPQDEEAVKFTDTFLNSHKGAEVILTGHSLGGHLAQHVKIAENLINAKVVTFNALGVVTNAKKDNFTKFIEGTTNFIIQGEIVDTANKWYAITNLGENAELTVKGDMDGSTKHKLINFYSFTKKTYAVYQNNKLLKSFYNLNNAKQLASMNLKTTIKNVDGRVVWTNSNRYAVYFHQTLLYTFIDRKNSDKFANVQAGRRVVDLKTNKNVYFKTNASFRYSVYLGKDKLDIFTSSTDAIKFAKQNSKRVVKDEKTKKSIYPVKK